MDNPIKPLRQEETINTMNDQPDNINTLLHNDGVTIDTSKAISPKQKEEMKDLLTCDYCSRSFPIKIARIGHMRTIHADIFYKEHPDIPRPTNIGGRPKKKKVETNKMVENISPTIVETTLPGETVEEEKKPFVERVKREEDEVREERDPTDNTTRKSILSKKSINLGGRELYMSELLINLGFAKDLAELQKKSLHLAFSMMNMGDLNTMMGEKKESITDMIEQLQKQELLDVQMEALKNKVKQKQGGGSKMESSDMLMMMMMMNNNHPKGNGDMMELFKIMMLDNKKDTVSEMQKMMELQRYLNPPQQNNNDNLKQQLEFLRLMIDNKRNDNDKLPEILKIIADKDKDRYERDMQMQQLKDESNRKLLDMKVTQLENQIRTPSNALDLDQIKATISAIKEVSGEIGGDRKPSTLDYIQTIGENFGPVVTELIKSRNPPQNIQAQVIPQNMTRNGMVHAEMEEEQNGGMEEEIEVQPSQPSPAMQQKPMNNLLNNFDSWIPRTPVELPGGRT